MANCALWLWLYCKLWLWLCAMSPLVSRVGRFLLLLLLLPILLLLGLLLPLAVVRDDVGMLHVSVACAMVHVRMQIQTLLHVPPCSMHPPLPARCSLLAVLAAASCACWLCVPQSPPLSTLSFWGTPVDAGLVAIYVVNVIWQHMALWIIGNGNGKLYVMVVVMVVL